MENQEFSVTVDGCDYSVEVWANGDCMRIYNFDETVRITAEFDHGAEQCFWDSHDEQSGEETSGEAPFFEFIGQPREELARWLVTIYSGV